MTCICAIIDTDKSILFGADSAGSSEYSIMITASVKIFQKDNLLFGVAGSWRQMQLLHHALVIPKKSNACTDEAYITLHVTDAIRSCFQDRNSMTVTNTQENSACAILIGYNGVLYRLNEDYGALISHTYDCIGSGDDVAKGALFATKEYSPIERITIALKAATEHTAFVRPPYVFERLAPCSEPHLGQSSLFPSKDLQKQIRSLLSVKQEDLGTLHIYHRGDECDGTAS